MRKFGRPGVKFGIDLLLWLSVAPVAFWIRLDSIPPSALESMLLYTLMGVPLKATAVYASGLHRRSWHRVGFRDAVVLGKGVAIATVLISAGSFFLSPFLFVPRGVPVIEGMLALVALAAARMTLRIYHETRRHSEQVRSGRAKRVVIVGCGESGTLIAREMLRHPEAGLIPVGFLDDDPRKQLQRFLGLRVLGSIGELPAVAARESLDEIIIAVPSARGDAVREIVELARQAGVAHRIIPGMVDLLSGKIAISQIREVDLEDLLRREPVQFDSASVGAYVRGRVVLITGAGGSIGSEIARQIADLAPKRVILLGRGENSIFEIEQECRSTWPHVSWTAVIADARDRDKLAFVFDRHHPEVVFHAAAHKHVPLMEHNPDEAILNNVGGVRNLTELALQHGVRCFVNISTDKAVNPTSIMGASKRVAEYLVHEASERAEPGQCFVSVRFGNVLGSRGSVVPHFKRQIKRGGPITVTHADVTRYFMTIPEAVQLVLQAGALGENGNVYVLDMGEPVRIIDLARDLILLSGLEPDVDVEIQVTGLRPGEKLFEELLTAEEGTVASRYRKIFVARNNGFTDGDVHDLVDRLLEAASDRDEHGVRGLLRYMIPTYIGETNGIVNHAANGASTDAADEADALHALHGNGGGDGGGNSRAHAGTENGSHGEANGHKNGAANGAHRHGAPPRTDLGGRRSEEG